MLEIIQTKNFKPSIKYKDYIFVFDKQCKAYNSWRCRYRSCLGRICTDFANTYIVRETLHNHTDMSPEIAIKALYDEMKKVGSLRNLNFNECLRESEHVLNIKFPANERVSSLQAKYVKFINQKNLPDSEGSGILEIYKNTYDKKQLLEFDSGNEDWNRIVIFVNKKFQQYSGKC